MIRTFRHVEGALRLAEDASPADEGVVWLDLMAPTREEETRVEDALGVDAPTREEMEEIEASSRLYQEDGALVMTVLLPARGDSDDPEMAPVSFVLASGRLITVRYHAPQAFETFPRRAEKSAPGCGTAEGVLMALLEAVVDRLADILERTALDIDALSHKVFGAGAERAAVGADALRDVLKGIGRQGDKLSDIRNSLMTLERAIGFLGQWMAANHIDKDLRARQKTLARDARSLSDHASFLSQKVQFLLDATLGLINIEQNQIIKIFSVVAVAFLPPTLIASIYGMNFEIMPELGWPFGYPMALGLMIVSAVAPMLYFRRRGWL
ncbi:MAG: magnesium/cobalt transporter CorA [Rubrimonas sp.]|uniref:magnesium/cobalt transporter CorA n=1 Tax=Rubrimonas sp. TaxID=2036015 RepID=UPI002FDDCC37